MALQSYVDITQDASVTIPIYKEAGGTYSDSGSWSYNEYCTSYPCAYDISIGISSDIPTGEFNYLVSLPNWITIWDTVTEQYISTGDGANHVSGDNPLKIHPTSENTSYSPRDGSIYITNNFGGSVVFYVYQGQAPVPPGFFVVS